MLYLMAKKLLEIRRAGIDDLGRLFQLQQQIADYHHRFDKIYNPAKNIPESGIKKYLRSILNKRTDRVYVLLCDGSIVGFATAHIKKMSPVFKLSKMGHIGTVYIEKKYRKSGLGTIAINESMSWFKKNKVSEIDLSVDVKNFAGVTAWKKMGFKDWRLVLRKKVT
jgi:ribosomal protein S18 acetylase RimI-like enzyme